LLANLRRLATYRALIQSLVVRDLKARYRGSVLGFLWSFINPLLLLLVYSFVFLVMPTTRGNNTPGEVSYPVLMFSGLLPWTWFSSSLLESSTVLVAGGNLIRKVLFPAEVLPLVTVIAGLVNFCLGLPILFGFILYFGVAIVPTDLLWLPVIMLVQLMLTMALALLLSALTVHFRDLRDLLANLLTLWFFATPILYRLPDKGAMIAKHHLPFGLSLSLNDVMLLNPLAHLARAYQGVLYEPGPYTEWPSLLIIGAGAAVLLAIGYFVFDRLRDTFAEAV
jgi:ABC-type polysaccharide/polyol phosphate export permease